MVGGGAKGRAPSASAFVPGPGLRPTLPDLVVPPRVFEAAIDVGLGTPLSEPALSYLRFPRSPAALRQEPTVHAVPLKALTALSVRLPGPALRSEPARAAEVAGLVRFEAADAYVMTLSFDAESHRRRTDLRPVLPMVLAW
jgi:hypothetical protein